MRQQPAELGAVELGHLAAEHVSSPAYTWTQGRGWVNSGAVMFPDRQEAFEQDLAEVIREWVISGHAPPAGMLGPDAGVITLGSCFARELRDYLAASGLGATNVWIPAGLNNTFAILDFVSWCVTGKETGRGYRYDRDDEGRIREWMPVAERERYVKGFREAGAFVFTLGLAEVWQDRVTGAVFWRGVPKDVYKADRHVFRLSTVEENEANVTQIVELVRSVNAAAPIVLTLSPVPLRATFRGISCLTADSVSKSVLRVALDLVMSRRLDNVWYWPSFEIVRWLGAHAAWAAFGEDEGKPRDVNRRLVAAIIDAFIEAFFTPDAVARLRAAPEAPRMTG
jgi:GSCFA family